MQNIKHSDPIVHDLIQKEYQRQLQGMELIASENYQSRAVLEAQSSVFANKYAEWFPNKRYYWWQDYTDKLEQLAIDRAKKIFSSDHANVQGLSGAAANTAIYAWLMEPWDTILGMDLTHGWHLTHGAPVTFLSKVYNFIRYKTTSDGAVDYDLLAQLAKDHKPKVILAGFSAYPRELDYAMFSQIASEVGAVAMADLSHIGGFIAAWLLQNPLTKWFQVMMTTTHKSLRWPRWSLILSMGKVSNPLKKPEDNIENIPTMLDRAVFPWTQWWPHMNTIAAIAVALKEASTEEFKKYAEQTLKNAQVMAQEFIKNGYQLVTGGTDNHMVIIDFSNKSYKGKEAENALDKIGISTSKSTIPDDPLPPYNPSGLRVGIQAMTTRGIKENDTKTIVTMINDWLKNQSDDNYLIKLKQRVEEFCKQFPIP